jgi:formate C-acetyltransferase
MISEYNGKHHGIRFQPGLYNYRDIVEWADMTRATPDGRRKGDFLAQGLTPQRYTRSLDIGGILRTVQALPLDDFPADSVLTLTIQRNGMTPDRLASVVKCFSGGNLQLNCLDRDELLDAMAHPERHRDLIVRLYGYSARFISLSGGMQREFISRSFL